MSRVFRHKRKIVDWVKEGITNMKRVCVALLEFLFLLKISNAQKRRKRFKKTTTKKRCIIIIFIEVFCFCRCQTLKVIETRLFSFLSFIRSSIRSFFLWIILISKSCGRSVHNSSSNDSGLLNFLLIYLM